MVGVDNDLRVRPFKAHGATISIREFAVGALHNELGMEVHDPDLRIASKGGRVVTPSGMVLDGSQDRIEAPPVNSAADDGDGDGVTNEVPPSLVDYLEFYLLNYFKPGSLQQTASTRRGREIFQRIGCGSCHRSDLWIERDRRVADVNTVVANGSNSARRSSGAISIGARCNDSAGSFRARVRSSNQTQWAASSSVKASSAAAMAPSRPRIAVSSVAR